MFLGLVALVFVIIWLGIPLLVSLVAKIIKSIDMSLAVILLRFALVVITLIVLALHYR